MPAERNQNLYKHRVSMKMYINWLFGSPKELLPVKDFIHENLPPIGRFQIFFNICDDDCISHQQLKNVTNLMFLTLINPRVMILFKMRTFG